MRAQPNQVPVAEDTKLNENYVRGERLMSRATDGAGIVAAGKDRVVVGYVRWTNFIGRRNDSSHQGVSRS